MKAKEEAKKKEAEVRLKREQEDANDGFDAEDGSELNPVDSPSAESVGAVVSRTDGSIPSGKDKIENLTGEWWKSSAVMGAGSAGKAPDEEWWKDLEGLDESMLGVEKDQWANGGSRGSNERFLSGGGVAGISEEDQAAIANADDPDTRRRVRAAYSSWCKMYNKEPDEGRFPKFKGNYLIMERMAIEQGREVSLNEFADCTPEEYRKAHHTPKRDSNVAETELQRKARLRKEREENDRRLERLRQEQEEQAAKSRKLSERKRNVNVATPPVDEDVVNESEAMAEVEKFAMKKAEEAAERVAAARKKNGSDIVARARARAMGRKSDNQHKQDMPVFANDELDKLTRHRLEIPKTQAVERPRDMQMKRDRMQSKPSPQSSPKMDDRWGEHHRHNERQDSSATQGVEGEGSPSLDGGRNARGNYPGSRPSMGADAGQPKVKPPLQTRAPKAFPPRQSFTSSRSLNNESAPSTTTDETFLDEKVWRDQYDRGDPDRGPSRFKQNIMKLRRDMVTGDESPFRGFGDHRAGVPQNLVQFDSEETLIDASDVTASFGNSDDVSPGSYRDFQDPSCQSDYDESYFMDLPPEDQGYPTPEVSPPSYSSDWSNEVQGIDDSSIIGGTNNVGSDWSSSSYNAPSPPSDINGESFTRRGPMMNQGSSSYLENLSRPSPHYPPPSGMNRGSPYLNDLSRQPQSSTSPPSPSSGESMMAGSEFPERIRAAYRDWCQYYDKPYNEGRLQIFATNFLAVEKYHRETGVSLILNELADMTSEEYQNRTMQ
jgi:hypothetical protein